MPRIKSSKPFKAPGKVLEAIKGETIKMYTPGELLSHFEGLTFPVDKKVLKLETGNLYLQPIKLHGLAGPLVKGRWCKPIWLPSRATLKLKGYNL